MADGNDGRTGGGPNASGGTSRAMRSDPAYQEWRERRDRIVDDAMSNGGEYPTAADVDDAAVADDVAEAIADRFRNDASTLAHIRVDGRPDLADDVAARIAAGIARRIDRVAHTTAGDDPGAGYRFVWYRKRPGRRTPIRRTYRVDVIDESNPTERRAIGVVRDRRSDL